MKTLIIYLGKFQLLYATEFNKRVVKKGQVKWFLLRYYVTVDESLLSILLGDTYLTLGAFLKMVEKVGPKIAVFY